MRIGLVILCAALIGAVAVRISLFGFMTQRHPVDLWILVLAGVSAAYAVGVFQSRRQAALDEDAWKRAEEAASRSQDPIPPFTASEAESLLSTLRATPEEWRLHGWDESDQTSVARLKAAEALKSIPTGARTGLLTIADQVHTIESPGLFTMTFQTLGDRHQRLPIRLFGNDGEDGDIWLHEQDGSIWMVDSQSGPAPTRRAASFRDFINGWLEHTA